MCQRKSDLDERGDFANKTNRERESAGFETPLMQGGRGPGWSGPRREEYDAACTTIGLVITLVIIYTSALSESRSFSDLKLFWSRRPSMGPLLDITTATQYDLPLVFEALVNDSGRHANVCPQLIRVETAHVYGIQHHPPELTR
ncbi:hypothetical protein OBBRIDRAFT_808573 [Obba rivulosa]|uniref:Uncharacterized protein n=1 Tax=Obba rivulosa TaxID=1052685 RepID=A0A8E2AGE1_9APHY|nr:hypothetical protein OBBRIDRAFT_808573 [Obba rivulosa]